MTKPWSALDTLKHTVLVVDDTIEYAVDLLAGGDPGLDDDDRVFHLMANAREQLTAALTEQIDGIQWNGGVRTITSAAAESLYRYDDGTPVVVDLTDARAPWRHWSIFPRVRPGLMDEHSRVARRQPDFARVVADDEEGR
ncbi:hypothetical protein [Cryocola sp. 340MFSha3.1]|uniref:hypothetical protein n=1 Tax=Cryocola sp. 340MFSha3.1 TaxID=1169145 RepID=UPI000364C06D|nr:hypothetical protein [Cryocola sp. 340MFSha3.1]